MGEKETTLYPALVGATGTGKTATLLALAEELPFAVIQADSMQALIGFDIGTAKPTLAEREKLPHYGLDVVPPWESYSAYEFILTAEKAIQQIGGDCPVLFSGGTVLYFKAWEEGLTELPLVDPEVRQEVRREVTSNPAKVYSFLKELDPLFGEKVHPHDLKRISRALEIYRVTSAPPFEFLIRGKKRRGTKLLYFGILAEGVEFKKALAARIQSMIVRGWIEETEGLVRQYGWELPGLKGVGYREIIQYLRGEISSRGELIRAIEKRTLEYVRKQRIFLRRLPVRWYPYDPLGINRELLRHLKELLQHGGVGKGL